MYTPAHEHEIASSFVADIGNKYKDVMERSASRGKMFADSINPDASMGVVVDLLEGRPNIYGLSAVILNDSHLFIYSVGQPWFAGGETWLIEQFYMRVGRGNSNAALEAVDELGRDLGCQRIVFGTSLAANDAALGRLLHINGYSPQSSQHIKEI